MLMKNQEGSGTRSVLFQGTIPGLDRGIWRSLPKGYEEHRTEIIRQDHTRDSQTKSGLLSVELYTSRHVTSRRYSSVTKCAILLCL
jgi:hypothetical protein